MGSPISNIVSEWKMRILENIIGNELKDVFKIWIRYADDIFAIISKSTDLTTILKKLKSFDKNIKFTIEIEKNNNLAFLDLLIHSE